MKILKIKVDADKQEANAKGWAKDGTKTRSYLNSLLSE